VFFADAVTRLAPPLDVLAPLQTNIKMIYDVFLTILNRKKMKKITKTLSLMMVGSITFSQLFAMDNIEYDQKKRSKSNFIGKTKFNNACLGKKYNKNIKINNTDPIGKDSQTDPIQCAQELLMPASGEESLSNKSDSMGNQDEQNAPYSSKHTVDVSDKTNHQNHGNLTDNMEVESRGNSIIGQVGEEHKE